LVLSYLLAPMDAATSDGRSRGSGGGQIPQPLSAEPLSAMSGVRAEMRLWLVALAVVLVVVAVAPPALAGNVAVILSSPVDDYREALRGFKEVAKHRIVAEYDMGGDPDRGPAIVAEIETKVKPDLIFAVGVWALQAAASHATTTPVVYAMVLNPPSVVGNGKNVTGASLIIPVEEALRLFNHLRPAFKRVGAIHSRNRTGYLVKRREPREERGHPAGDARDHLAQRDRGRPGVAPGRDRRVVDPARRDHARAAGPAADTPVLLPKEDSCSRAVRASRSARRAVRALVREQRGHRAPAGRPGFDRPRGAEGYGDPGHHPAKVNLTVNLKTAGKLGIEVPKTILGRATTVIQ